MTDLPERMPRDYGVSKWLLIKPLACKTSRGGCPPTLTLYTPRHRGVAMVLGYIRRWREHLSDFRDTVHSLFGYQAMVLVNQARSKFDKDADKLLKVFYDRGRTFLLLDRKLPTELARAIMGYVRLDLDLTSLFNGFKKMTSTLKSRTPWHCLMESIYDVDDCSTPHCVVCQYSHEPEDLQKYKIPIRGLEIVKYFCVGCVRKHKPDSFLRVCRCL